MRASQRVVLALIVCGWVASIAQAEIPNQSRENLLENASHAFDGRVERIYATPPRRERGYEYVDSVAEVVVVRVEKGSEVAVGDRVYVRHWHKHWIGGGSPPPDHYGHRTVPAVKQTVSIFVSGDRKQGYDVLSPNGYFEVVKAEKK